MKRRAFLKNSTVFTLPAFLGGFDMAAMPSSLMATLINGDSDKVLVLIDLNGGNDGLNTFVPMDVYGNLANARPDVILPESSILDMTDTIGLHPEMTGIKNMYDNSNLTLIQGVGYPDQNRSHFRSSDIWNTGSKSDEYKPTGWMGRYLDDSFPGYPSDFPTTDCPDPFAVTMGRSISGTCQGMDSNFSLAIINTDDIGGLDTGVEVPQPNDCYGAEMDFLVETFKKSNAYADRVVAAADAGDSNENLYPDTTLANQLKTVAKLISGGLQTKIYVLKLSGFDTHSDQVVDGNTTQGWHADLIKNLSDAIYAFQEDLKLQGLEDRVIGCTFSEFGRKIISNAGMGTDHGSAAPMMVFGSCINPGVIGDNPQIGTDVDSDEGVAMQYDFKWVFGSILMDWFEVSEDKVKLLLSDDFQHLPIVGTCDSTATEEIDKILDSKAFPNPFDRRFTLSFSIVEKDDVRIDLYDVMGKIIRTISNKTFTSGEHNVLVEANSLSAGVYFARIQVGNGVKTLRVVKH